MIVTAVGGLKETIGDTGTGIVTEEGTPEAVRESIEKYFADPSIRTGCIEAMRREKKRLSWEEFARQLTAFADELQKKI